MLVAVGRADQHRLERELAGSVRLIARQHVREVVGDEDHVATARLAREREPVALVEVVVGPPETPRRAVLERA
jgi:hypothetical protein